MTRSIKDEDGNRHSISALPADGTHVDIDGHATYNTRGDGQSLPPVALAIAPELCPACTTMPDPLTLACRC